MPSNRNPLSSLRRSARRVVPALLLLFATAAHSQTAVPRGRMAVDPGQPHLAKASGALRMARELALAGPRAGSLATAAPGLRLRDGQVEVEIKLSAVAPEVIAALAAGGLEVESSHPRYDVVYGRLDPKNLSAITALSEVRIVRQKPRARTRVGSAANQGDQTMNTDDVRLTFGYDGTDVEVGVLSDSFRDLSPGSVSGVGCNRQVTGTASQTSGDLPNGMSDVASLDDGPGGPLSDEGRAIAELIFDIAPSVTFSFHTAFNSPADFAGGITELVGCGADLIVDDVFWTGQPFFQDGPIAAAAQDAADAGVPYFSAAGNDATFGIHDLFVDSDPMPDTSPTFPDGKDFHDFDPGIGVDTFAEIVVPEGCEIFSELQWSEPFFDAGPPAVGALSDLDLYLLDSPVAPVNAIPAGSNILNPFPPDLQGCGTVTPDPDGDPLESNVFWTNTGPGARSVFLAIDRVCGPVGSLELRVLNISFDCSVLDPGWDFEDGGPSETPIFVDTQIFGHPAAKDAIAVAAAFFREIDTGGATDPPSGQLDVEPFSSLGGDLPFYFDENGVALPGGPEHRFKPEVTGPDGTNTSFFGTDIADSLEPPGDTDPNFFGTSAAAPNSAAIAALILDATDLTINPRPLKQLLEQSAIDMELTGPDDLSGFGFTDALRPIKSLDPTAVPDLFDLEFDLDGSAFFKSPPPGGMQRLQAKKSITYADGDFSGLDAFAESHIFADGFESGDTSAWTSSAP